MGWFVVLALLWLQFALVLHVSWMDGTYYDYGWLVLPFAALFWVQRFREMPLQGGGRGTNRAPFQRWEPRLQVFLALGFALLIPLRIVEEADIYWRLPLWLHAVLIVMLSLAVCTGVWGWRVTRNLLPAFLFALVAVPLPSFLEHSLVRGLTQQVVGISSGLLPMLAYPVDVQGNSFIVNGGLLDVAEGCSGIRSFQSSAMAALCFGELFRMTKLRRMALLVLGMAIAVLCNSLRVVILVALAFKEGSEAMDSAHDSIGLWVMTLTYICIGAAAWFVSQDFFGSKIEVEQRKGAGK